MVRKAAIGLVATCLILVTYLVIANRMSRGEVSLVTLESGVIAGLEHEGIKRFYDIPYAEPPVGDLRWAPPRNVKPWQGTRKADTAGAWCPQMDFNRTDEGTMKSGPGYTFFIDVPVPEQASENCLSVNVWTPVDARSASVVVFIHGNALSGSHPFFDGSGFAKDGVVFVSINYRMLTLGNFAHSSITAAAPPDEPLGRYSTLDQMAALQWVQDNIAAFGGDPDRVTLMGHSAGGASIAHLLATSQAEGLFQQAIIQSGNGWWSPIGQDQHEKFGCLVLRYSGYDECDLTIEQLRAIPWQDLAVTGPYSIDGRYWKKGATEVMAKGGAIDVPLMIGFTSYDGSSLRFSPKKLFRKTDPDVLATYEGMATTSEMDRAIKIYTDQHSAAPARWVAHSLSSGEPTWLYQFSHILGLEGDDAGGASHGAELPFVFDNWKITLAEYIPFGHLLPFSLEGIFLNDDDRAMTIMVHECWVTFIKVGTPSCKGAPTWPAYNRVDDELMNFDVNSTIIKGFHARQLDAHEVTMDEQFRAQQRTYEELLADQ